MLCVNVLEHIADDVGALKAFKRILVPGGRVIVFVPAAAGCVRSADAELGHHRRYSKRTLRAAFTDAGLELIRLRYTNPDRPCRAGCTTRTSASPRNTAWNR